MRLDRPTLVLGIALVAALAACGAPRGGAGYAWDGRRGYDGSGDYGYDPAAPREADAYRARAAQNYPVPGPPGDPWAPYVHEAAARYGVPESWIRAVMRQESGGRLLDSDGTPITSGAGAMGLMQIMPGTWEMLRASEGLGGDPYEPHDNILAGAAYLRAMYDRFGAPGFLAAYNAGPDRVAAYLAGTTGLPDETIGYVAAIGPSIGMPATLGGGGSAYARAYARAPAGTSEVAMAPRADPSDAAYLGGGAVGDDAAYEGGGAVGDDAAYAGGGMSGVEYFGKR